MTVGRILVELVVIDGVGGKAMGVWVPVAGRAMGDVGG